MPQINVARREIICKLVYYGPGLSGKTTNVQVVHRRAPLDKKSELVSIATEGDRTLFFDYMPLDLGTVAGMRVKLQLYSVPGQRYYNATRELVLRGVDGVVFVADSQAEQEQENLESLANLEENLLQQGVRLKDLPIVMQWNKRDMPSALPLERLEATLNRHGWPSVAAIAVSGEGVFPTLRKLTQLVLEKLHGEYVGGGERPARREPTPPRPTPTPTPRPTPVRSRRETPRSPAPVVSEAPAPSPVRPLPAIPAGPRRTVVTPTAVRDGTRRWRVLALVAALLVVVAAALVEGGWIDLAALRRPGG